MVSDVIEERAGYLALSNEEYAVAKEQSLKTVWKIHL